MEDFSLKDVLYICGILITITGSYLTVKYQGIINAKDIKAVSDSNSGQWATIDEIKKDIINIKERIAVAISMEMVEEKFVTTKIFDLTMKQFTLDLEQTKSISQSTLDAVQILTSSINRNKDSK